jgi:hypothetical protein
LELQKFRIESKNETMEVQARIFDQVLVTFFLTCKIKKYNFQNFQPSFNISNQMELLDFLISTFSLPLVSFSKTIVQKIIIWTWKSTPKASPKIMLIFEGCE